MHIAVNAASLLGAGASIAGRTLLGDLSAAAPGHQLSVWVPRSWDAVALPGLTAHAARSGGWKKIAFEAWLPRELRRARASVLFNLCDTPLPRGATPELLMVQQAHLAYPTAEWGYVPPPRSRARFALIAAYFAAGVRRVRHFTVQTADMRERLALRWDLDPDAITVVPSAVDRLVLDRAALPPVQPDEPPYVCYVTSHAPHKNLAVLAPMMAALRSRRPELVCCVTAAEHDVPDLVSAATRLGVRGSFDLVGGLSRERTLDLLSRATAAIIPSVLESFGLAYYEALALGVPVVAADRAFAREACADAALYAPHDAPGALADALCAVLQERDAWSRRARERFARVHVGSADVARRYVAILERIMT